MKRVSRIVILLLLALTMSVAPARAAGGTRVIVRVGGGLLQLKLLCVLLGCNVNYGLGDPGGQLFLITVPLNLSPLTFLNKLQLNLGVLSAEIDVKGSLQTGTTSAPPALSDRTPLNYYGTTVWHGYVYQPATQLVRLADVQKAYGVDGSGIVAVIDTGVDATHPVLQSVLLPGYDFTRNRNGADEKGDVSQSTADVVDGGGPVWVNDSTLGVVNQSTADVVDTGGSDAFGHGTMVAGIVHLVAPRAQILPLKAFNADGTGYTSDAIRAIYWAVKSNARVLNMSFSFANSSNEFANALAYASKKNVISVASAGNDGVKAAVYPAGFSSSVMGVASTSNTDTRSSFSNYGTPQVYVAAPGEWIVTTYPWGTYAASSGTSFSAPFVAGAAALLLDVNTGVTEATAAQAIGNAKYISSDLGKGRLDLYQAVAAWRHSVGLP
jgi:hypothetical protein